MTPNDIQLVRESFALVEPIAPQAAAIFYEKLFAAAPAVRKLFSNNMEAQGERLMTMIAGAVALLDRPEQLMPVLQKLGAQHSDYGVIEAHYAQVGAALIDTLHTGLGPAFTPEVCEAWKSVYSVISHTMIGAARVAMAA